MSEPTLNLGILAHVDAGKTTLTERLLHAAGVIDEPGSVDAGTTQTDTLALERQRGITIKSAVVSFALDGVIVNLIDTPGHPDFIAEVERVLGVLDGAVLVISAVEGVQPQTTLLMRALQRLGVPTLIFVNKIDRRGADAERTLAAIEERLTPAVFAMGAPADLGTAAASFAAYGPGRRGAGGAVALRSSAPRVLRFGADRRRHRVTEGGRRRSAACSRRRSGRAGFGPRLQDRARPGRRAGRVHAHVLGHLAGARPPVRGQGDGDPCLRRRQRRPPRLRRRGPDREAAGSRRAADRRPDRRAACGAGAPLRASDPRDRGGSRRRDRGRPPPSRAGPARRAGPVDRSPPGRMGRPWSRSTGRCRKR